MLLDTNIVIYLNGGTLPARAEALLHSSVLSTCNIVVAEVMGYRAIAPEDAVYFKRLFAAMRNHPFDGAVTDKVVEIQKHVPVKLPDAIIAATALVHDLDLWTHNIDDFKAIPGIRLFDPLA